MIEQNHFRSFIYGQSSTNPANLVKIGPVDFEIIGATEITKIFLKTTAKQKAKAIPLYFGITQSIINRF